MTTPTWLPGDHWAGGRTNLDPTLYQAAGDVPRVGFGWAKGQAVATKQTWIALAEHRAIVAQLEAAIDALVAAQPAIDQLHAALTQGVDFVTLADGLDQLAEPTDDADDPDAPPF